ncbi:hypothetical protein NZK32_15260 [Cyanobium sp. FGCU-52]|nr:hypothetical protein [Cyanobium sp. FGCU52]
MPLPTPPGYRRGRQRRVDRRSILLAAVLAGVAAGVLLALAHRVARTPGDLLKPLPWQWVVLVVGGASACGAWGETMRQLALTRLGEPGAPDRL